MSVCECVVFISSMHVDVSVRLARRPARDMHTEVAGVTLAKLGQCSTCAGC
jgi:hypothetical protein